MAGDWIKLRKDIFHDHRVAWMADQCSMSRQQVVGWLACIWAWADSATADGVVPLLSLNNVQDITCAPDKLLACMRQVGWIVDSADGISFPNFEEHMSASAKKRAQDAEKKRKKRSMSRPESVPHAEGQKRGLEKRREENTGEHADILSEVEQVIRYYTQDMGHGRYKGGEKDEAKIRARLREGYSVADLKDAIDGCHLSPHHCGDNEQGKKYQSLELIVRDSKHVADFIEIKQNPPKPKQGRTAHVAGATYDPNRGMADDWG